MTWRRFCDDFCRTKKYYMFKTLANHSRRVRDACRGGLCDTMRTFRDTSRRFCESIRKPIANSSHPSEIGSQSIRTQVNSYSFWSICTQNFGQFVLIWSIRTHVWSVRTHFGQFVLILVNSYSNSNEYELTKMSTN